MMARPKSVQPDLGENYVGTKDAAAILGVSVSSVQKMVNAGTLEAFRTSGGHRRISIESLQRLAAEKSIPVATLSSRMRPHLAGNGALTVLVVEDNAVTC